MLTRSAAVTGIAVLVWLQVAVHGAAGVSVALPRACPSRAGPGKMVVVAAPAPHSPYYSWEECEYAHTLPLIDFLLLPCLDTYMMWMRPSCMRLHGVLYTKAFHGLITDAMGQRPGRLSPIKLHHRLQM